ncbi:MAG TPA: RNA polymerase sigma-70 factor [Chitinophagaceae bacterium]|nr:RNA polymerase sigma-70 factor [Chitinophagaceae bacterium]
MHEPAIHNEPELLRMMAAGDETAFRTIYDRYWDRVYSTAYAFTKSVEQSRDLAQDVFATIWAYREKLKAVNSFEAYLYTIARNTASRHLRKKTYIPANISFFESHFAGTDAVNENIDLKELKELVEQGIQSLPAQQQTAFRLSRFAGLSIDEIAKEMGLTPVTAKSHLVRATARLRKYLDEHRDPIILIWILLFL